MSTITKLYPLLKDIGLDDKKSQEFIEIIEDSYHSEIEQENKKLVTNETFLTETTKLREEMASFKGEIKAEMAIFREEIKAEMASFKEEIKAGMAGFREEMKGDMAGFREGMKDEMAKFRGDSREEMTKTRVEMVNMKTELIKWNVGTIIAVAGVVTAITKLIG